MDGVVRHAPVPIAVSAQLGNDFRIALPSRLTFPRDNDVFSFEFTSSWTDTAARYVIGLAALVSGDADYAEMLLLSAEERLKHKKAAGGPFRKLAEDLPARLQQLYMNWINAYHDTYVTTGEKGYLEQAEERALKLLERSPSNYNAMLILGICAFVLRRDVGSAKHYIRGARRVGDVTWRYSLAFLYAYEGRMKEARAEYARAFAGQLNDVTIPVQCDLFIQAVLAEEPDRAQLHFAAGLINQHVKSDSVLAISEYQAFIAHPNSINFPEELQLARVALVDLRHEADAA